MNSRKLIPNELISSFLEEHQLPELFRQTIRDSYSQIAQWINAQKPDSTTMLVGISGAQGTGKSTLAEFLALALRTQYERRVAVLSIDDFYLEKKDRQKLSRAVHPLLITRGVPGTHDIELLQSCLDRLDALRSNETCFVPRFDKAVDDRCPRESWSEIKGPIDIVILEGWCIASEPQPQASLAIPINKLEETEDADGKWRAYVNQALLNEYLDVFKRLDKLIFLKVPNMDIVFRWRQEQEKKLAARTKLQQHQILAADADLVRFIQHFERITKANLTLLPAKADIVIELNTEHQPSTIYYQT